MDKNNAGWGRGRGRGFTVPKTNITNEPWKRQSVSSKQANEKPQNKMIDMEERYGKFLNNYESSSSEDELNDDEIVSKLTKSYNDTLGW